MLRSEAAVGGVIRLSTVTEPDVPWQVQFADPSKDPQLGLEQREQALRPVLVDIPTRVFLLGVIDELVHIAFERPIAAGRIRVQLTAHLDGEVRRLLHRFHGEISRRLDDDSSLATDPRDNGRPVFVIVAPTGVALLTAPPRLVPQGFLATAVRLPLAASDVVEIIRFHRAFQPAIGFIGHGRVTQPPAPAIARPAMHPHLPGNASRRTRQAQQEGRKYPVRQRPLAPVEQGLGEVVEGALAAVTPVAFAPGAVVVRAPRIDVLALAPGTLEWTIFPPQRMNVRLALCGVEEVVYMGEHRHS
jgi:hypothetical protein